MKHFLTTLSLIALTACQTVPPPQEASQAEKNMAEMMGITVEELRNQTPEEHMRAMQEMMMNTPQSSRQETPAASIRQIYEQLSPQAQALYYRQSDQLTKPVPDRLVELDTKTIGCFGPSQVLGMSPSDGNLGGQCCGALTDIDAYDTQLQAIERFKLEQNDLQNLIPQDPYDISVEVAQRLTQWDKDIVLTSDQQMTFDEAVSLSHHGGPCCCKCWKWYVMSGLAKKFIVDEQWNADQIAELWDISSSCGHSEDTDMHQHYSFNSLSLSIS